MVVVVVMVVVMMMITLMIDNNGLEDDMLTKITKTTRTAILMAMDMIMTR